MTVAAASLPITAIVAVRNEAPNMVRCLKALAPVRAVVVVDSHSHDDTAALATQHGARVVQFDYTGGYPKKRQWAMDTLTIETDWILLVDADEEAPPALWEEIAACLAHDPADAYLLTKQFHFGGKCFRWGGFSHAAVLLFRRGHARFEHLFDEPADAADMEVHERLLVEGRVARIQTPLIHEDFKGLAAYKARHDVYAEWEARARLMFLKTGQWGANSIRMNPLGNVQERRRFLKAIAIRMPLEPLFWFLYHYLFRLGILEGRAGFTASYIRAGYIANARRRVRQLQHNPTAAAPSAANPATTSR